MASSKAKELRETLLNEKGKRKNKSSHYLCVSLSPVLSDIILTFIAYTIFVFFIFFYGQSLYNINNSLKNTICPHAYVAQGVAYVAQAVAYVTLLFDTLCSGFCLIEYFTQDRFDKGTKAHSSIAILVRSMVVVTVTWAVMIDTGGVIWMIGRCLLVYALCLIELWIKKFGLAMIRRLKLYYRTREDYCWLRIEIVFFGSVFEYPLRKSLLDF